jgi:hypothetical protein
MVMQLCEMKCGDKTTVENTMSYDDGLEWFMLRKYDSYVQDQMMKNARR